MPLLSYKAMDARGKVHKGRMEAAGAQDLEARLQRMGLDLIRAQEMNEQIRAARKIGRRELMAFCFHLEQLLGAGVPLLEGLTDLRDSVDDPGLRQTIAMLIEHIEGGKTLSKAKYSLPTDSEPVP